ncbi:MAG: chemotaxis protein CheW [Leptospirillia bacterium]
MESSGQMLVFSVRGVRYAMDILDLHEVGRMPEVEEEPGAPEPVLGVIRLHGDLVRVYDLGQVLEGGSDQGDPYQRRPWMLAIRTPQGPCHWQVDWVDDIVDYDPQAVVTESGSQAGSAKIGLLELDGQLFHLLGADRLAKLLSGPVAA